MLGTPCVRVTKTTQGGDVHKAGYDSCQVTYLDALELIRLESPDFVRLLLDNLGLVQRLYCHYFIFNTQSLS